MKEAEYKILNPLADMIDEKFEQACGTEQISEIKAALQKVSSLLPASYSLSIDIELRVFDPDRKNTMVMLSRGIATEAGEKPYEVSADSTIQRYIVDGEICQTPHDYCPHCWNRWGFKLKNRICSGCGYTLGKQIKLLLDTNVCPQCEEGKISLNNPTCTSCGFEVDLNIISWG